ncbi:MAG TPA: hypothetical protein V6D07_18385 [Trichocoleus sp.]
MASSSSVNSQPSSRVHRPPRRWQRELLEWLWPILWMALLLGSGVFAGWALVWLTRIPPLPNCDEISRLSSNRDRIYCAKAEAKSATPEDLVAAIVLTKNWPKNHVDYKDAQETLKEASEKLLVLASRQVQSGNLEVATALARQIPEGTPLRKPAQAAIYEWQQEWSTAQTLESTLATSIQARNWNTASEALQNLKKLKSDYWLRDRHQYWQSQLQREQRSWENLVAARELAGTNRLKDLKAALTLARQVDLGSRVWIETEQDINRWSRTLLNYGLEQWRLGNLEGAMVTVQQVPPSADWEPEAQTLIQFSHAKALADKANPQAPAQALSYAQMLYLIEAIGGMTKIPADSSLKASAQEFVSQWQAELEDATQLQFAHTISKFGQGATYQLAIQQANTIEPNRPRRLQAQTLVAHWQNELERIADRPILRRADQLAKAGTIPGLQQAIAEATQIEADRALRVDAQTRIADWQREIQEIEDRPIIDEAVALAEKNKLKDAIVVAQKVKPNRALYARAQTLIKDWTRTVQIREDQPILNKAKDLAYEGSLTAAIETASQIGLGRALYPEAQRAIALWEDERAYIWSIWGDDSGATDQPELSESELE